MKNILKVVLLLLLPYVSFSQQKNLGTWNMVNTKINLGKKWSVFGELQLRTQLFYDNPYYYEVKGGASYAINKNFSFLLGVGKYLTYADDGDFKGPLVSNETRNWQQLTISHYLERIKFEHRYRVEQRWISTGYRNRFRYRLNMDIPLHNKKLEPKTFYLSAFNEIFLTNREPFFQRNRVFGGVGYKVNKNIVILSGVLHQFDYQPGKKTNKNFLQLNCFIELNLKHVSGDKIPVSID